MYFFCRHKVAFYLLAAVLFPYLAIPSIIKSEEAENVESVVEASKESSSIDLLKPTKGSSEGRGADIYSSWNSHLKHSLENRLVTISSHSDSKNISSASYKDVIANWFKSSWQGLLAGAVLIAIPAIIVARRRKKFVPEVDLSSIEIPGLSTTGKDKIRVTTTHIFSDQSMLLLANINSERYILGMTPNRDFVTLLGKLSETDSLDDIDAESFAQLLKQRYSSEQTSRGAFSSSLTNSDSTLQSAVNPNFSRVGSPLAQVLQTESEDEDLEALLDELLGKVRGLKSLPKRNEDRL